MEEINLERETMSGRDRARKLFDNTCMRCGGNLDFCFNDDGLCDDCITERSKMQYDAANPLPAPTDTPVKE